jgi:Putative DNA-binding domain
VTSIDLVDLAGKVPDQECWLRLLVEPTAAGPILRYGCAVVGPKPRTWTGESWHYAAVHFISAKVSVTALVDAMSSEAETVSPVQLGGVDLVLPRVQASVQVQHRPSFELHDRDLTPLPSFDFAINRHGGTTATSTVGRGDFLIAPDGPSFTDLDAAYRVFFMGRYDVPANESVPSELLRIRVLDERSWLGPMHIRATELTVEIRGSEPVGTMLEYFSPTRRERFTVERSGEHTVHLPDGLPASNTWLWLTDGSSWRDYRALSGPWTSVEQLEAAGVERQQTSRDEQAAVEAVVFGGEGPFVEFKSRLPDGGPKTDRMFRTIAAFANGAGGTVVLGVDRDELTVVGLGQEVEVTKERDRVGQLIRTRVPPTPEFMVNPYQVDGRDVLFVEVSPGPARPYGVILDLNQRDTPQFYVRRGASTYPAQPSDLNQVVQEAVARALGS